ncbi:cytochrome c oxidase assembly protein [Mycobacterium vicinigordonae]|uniref:Cytochrome c oxidase assembly protein n=2 Tax=Mycobacterium vicinigordonae TaxID=1719132 RepID=A0A7D6IX15_9MYCO|nr:cytochrome c oxidase assembly protein [Mycobacterium vicinigordonae]
MVMAAAAGCYFRCYQRARPHSAGSGPAVCFGLGLALWAVATLSGVGAYAYSLFWMRALQVLLLLYVVPLFLALGRPVSVVCEALGPVGRDRVERLLARPIARLLAHPLTTSLAMLAAPWLLYMTPWYEAALRSDWVGAPTRILLVAIGFGYFYARLQADPVPRRYSQLISLVITVVEALADGVLGLVIWQGSLIAASYYEARTWGPDQRLDQTIGAGVLWIVGDLVAWPFLLLLMRALSRDEQAHAVDIDAQLDNRLDVQFTDLSENDATSDRTDACRADETAPSTLWWEHDPQLRERFGRR